MNIWITTDTHFGHHMLIDNGYRPKDFEKRIIKGFKQIEDNDILIHLGDVGLVNHKIIKEVFGPMKCKKILCKGNHDGKTNKWYLEHGFDFVCHSFRDRLFGKIIVFSHIPIKDDGYDLNIHGHFHGNDKRYEAELLAISNDKQVEVALEETNYQPVLLRTLIEH